MSTLKDFVHQTARPLPVIILADVSGSMSADGKIHALNQAMLEMVRSFATIDSTLAEVHLAVITFGGEAKLAVPLQPAKAVAWVALPADGGTPMGDAFTLAAQLIDDPAIIPSRAYRPTVVLVSDGCPTDDWRTPLTRFTGESRASKADRMALSIGADADRSMLAQFLADSNKQVFHAADATQIRSFFRFVTMSVSTRMTSVNPNVVPLLPPPADLGDL